jgi:hypothetical protein
MTNDEPKEFPMRLRRSSCWALLGLLLLPAAARPDGNKQGADEKGRHPRPTLVLRVRSIDTVLNNIKLFARLTGKEEFGDQINELIKQRVGPNGLEGIDTARPVGLYGDPSEALPGVAAVAMIPIADEKAFLSLLENLNYKAEKNKDGLYVIQPESLPGVSVGIRFAHKYAYVTALNLQAVRRDNLVEPARIFPAKLTADVSATVRIDRLPKTAKDLALGRMEERLAQEKEKKKPGETEVQHRARGVLLDAFAKQVAEVLENGRELDGRLEIDRGRQELSVRLDLDARPGSALARDIRALGEGKSLFGGLTPKGAALSGLAHLVLPEAARKAVGAVLDEAQAEALRKETNPEKRRQIERFSKVLLPTLKSGELDLGFSLRGPHPSGLYTSVTGLKVQDGEALEQAVRAFTKDLPADKRERIKLDVATAAGVQIHRIDAQKDFDKGLRQAVGDNPVYVAFRADAVFLALGEDGLGAIKEAVAAGPAASPPLALEVSLAHLARLAKTAAERKAAAETFHKGEAGKIRLTLRGGPALSLQLRADLSVIRFAGASYRAARSTPDEDEK